MEKNLEFDTGTELLDEHDLHDVLNRLPEAFDLFNGPSSPPPSSPVLHPTASMAEWLKAWDTLAMMKLSSAGGHEFAPRPGHYSRMSF